MDKKIILALSALYILNTSYVMHAFGFGFHVGPDPYYYRRGYYDPYYYDSDYGKAALATDIAGGVIGTIFAAKEASEAKKARESIERQERLLEQIEKRQRERERKKEETYDSDYNFEDDYYED